MLNQSILSITVKEISYWDTASIPKTTAEVVLYRKRSNNWPMISFIHNECEAEIYRISSGNKLGGIASYMTA